MITNGLSVIAGLIQEEPETRKFVLSDGDSGLVIRKSGKVELFQQAIDTSALQEPIGSLSETAQQTLLNGQLLMVLSIVANSPAIQQTILSFAVNEGVATVPAANANA